MIQALLAFLFGLLIGSFLNVCIYRWPRDLSVVRPRSHCPACDATIAWYDNVPLLSYLLLRGRCRHCGARIPLRYPVVELLTAVCFALAVLTQGLSIEAARICVFSALLIGLIFADWEERILPDEMTLGGSLVGLVFAAVKPIQGGILSLFLPSSWHPAWGSVLEAVLGALFCTGLMWVVRAAYFRVRHKEGLGLGDLKMILMIGVFLGLPNAIMSLMLASVLGSIVGLAYILMTRKDAGSYELPFGSFLGLAALAVGLFGSHFH